MREHLQPLVNAILYADVFNFALSKKELYKYAIGKCTKEQLSFFVQNLPNYIYYGNRYFSLADSKENIQSRLKRKNININKLKIAQKIAKKISIFPTVKLVGLSGAVAMQNATPGDDIDLFIISKKNSIWTTRLLVTFLMVILGKKRGFKNKNINNKICLNMFMSEDNLSFTTTRRDLYTAHEIAQMIPLIDKNKTYDLFISENGWIKKYLPNSIKSHSFISKKNKYSRKNILEKIAQNIQLWYMRKRRTIEEVSEGILAFHPLDYRNKTLKEYNDRRKKYVSV